MKRDENALLKSMSTHQIDFWALWIFMKSQQGEVLQKYLSRKLEWILTTKYFCIKEVKMAGNLADNIVNKMMDPTRTQNQENQDIMVTLSFPILTQHERLRDFSAQPSV